ncbi:MAG: hypothetical protein NTX50_20690 [Candidatus Sumerlaeota bacterium]|nr:hypothetical protein [Candidatus Sumerlaeota bacterium]
MRKSNIVRLLVGVSFLFVSAIWAAETVKPMAPPSAPPLPSEPARDIQDVVVYTMNELTNSDASLDLAKRARTEMLIRGWFKWNKAPAFDRWRDFAEQAHRFGALFGGGITCSALYDGENGLTQEQWRDMATRGPDRQIVEAWGQKGIRHGSLSCPAYLDYLFRWCREQMDAGADYLFMDEHTAALGGREGYDDYSIKDFRTFLLEHCPQTSGWKPDDPRWQSQFKIALDDKQICPGGNMTTFDYRAWLKAKNLTAKTDGADNPMSGLWHNFRAWRDDRAWKSLTDRIRAYAAEKKRRVYISANGLARYVDLQVLGVWGYWSAPGGKIALSQSQIPTWRTLVAQGQELAERRVPVVLFHDWGFGNPPFPWLAVKPGQRELWMRTRGAEIYAAGGFFAFPVLGPFGCDAGKDGTLPTITRQAAFYQANRDLFLKGRFLSCERLTSDADSLSLAAWIGETPQTLALHVINRKAQEDRLEPRNELTVKLPLNETPERAFAVSPDWEGEKSVQCQLANNQLSVTLRNLEAYAIIRLIFKQPVNVTLLKDPPRVRLTGRWERPARNEFRVHADGAVEKAFDLSSYLQGMLHTELRNPPTFLVNAAKPATLSVHVQAVASTGARLEYRVDNRTERTVDLPDLDHKNDATAPEYNRVFKFEIPAGSHRLTLDNTGADWLSMDWLEFQGEFLN